MQICNNCKEPFDLSRITHPICRVSWSDDRFYDTGPLITKLDYCKDCGVYLNGGNVDAFHKRYREIILQPRE